MSEHFLERITHPININSKHSNNEHSQRLCMFTTEPIPRCNKENNFHLFICCKYSPLVLSADVVFYWWDFIFSWINRKIVFGGSTKTLYILYDKWWKNSHSHFTFTRNMYLLCSLFASEHFLFIAVVISIFAWRFI